MKPLSPPLIIERFSGWIGIRTGLILIASVFSKPLSAAPGDILGSFNTGGPIFASPTLSPDGTLFIGSNDGRCYAIENHAGVLEQKWAYAADEWIDSSVALGLDGTIYTATYNSTLVALDPLTGSERWSVAVGQAEGALSVIQSSPAVAEDGTIILTTTAGFAHAFDSMGNEIWTFEIGAESQSSPVVDDDGNIYFGADDGLLYSLDSAGRLRWTFAVDNAGASGSRIYASPAIDGDGNIYFGSGNGYLYSLTPQGKLRWKFDTPEAVDASPAIDQENHIYFASRNGFFFSLDQDGAVLWSTFLGDIFFSSPVIDTNGFVYAAYFGGQGKSFVVAFAPGGVEVWQAELDTVIDSSPSIALDGTLYVAGFDGRVYAIEGSGKPLDYLSPWPRFRRDTRGRGRYVSGPLPSITEEPAATMVLNGSSAEIQVATGGNSADQFFWRKEGVLVSHDSRSNSHIVMNADEDDIGLYDVVVSNEVGAIASAWTYLSTYSAPTYEIRGSDTRFEIEIAYPDNAALKDIAITRSSDLVDWSERGIDIESETSVDGLVTVRARLDTSADGAFLRLEIP